MKSLYGTKPWDASSRMVKLDKAKDAKDDIVEVKVEDVTKVGVEEIIRSKQQHLILNKNREQP